MREEETKAVYYRGQAFRTKKSGGRNNPHTTPSAEGLERMRPFLDRIGVSRIANITGLDRCGIPVANAFRPHIHNPSVTHGKGLAIQDAMASAAMEAVERYHCFIPGVSTVYLPYSELSKRMPVIPLDRLALSKNSLFHVDAPEHWVMGWDIVNQEETAVPFGFVNLGYPPSQPLGLQSFQTSSNGFAGGLDFLEATSQALVEVIERDAIACSQMAAQASGSALPLNRVQLDTIEFPVVRDLLDRIERAGTLPLLFDCTVDTEVPTYNCFLFDRLLPDRRLAHGMGASLDPVTAMIRAVTEAVLARAVFYSGVREMNSRDLYDSFKSSGPEGLEMIRLCENGGPRVDARGLQSEATPSFEEDIHLCIEKLKKVGIDQVIVFDITEPDFAGSVVRVVVPGLEGYITSLYTPGSRARDYLRGNNK